MKWPKAVEKVENGGRLGSPRQNFWSFLNGPLVPPAAEGPIKKQFLFGMGPSSHSQLQLGPAPLGRYRLGPSLAGVSVRFQEKRGPVIPSGPLPKLWTPKWNHGCATGINTILVSRLWNTIFSVNFVILGKYTVLKLYSRHLYVFFLQCACAWTCYSAKRNTLIDLSSIVRSLKWTPAASTKTEFIFWKTKYWRSEQRMRHEFRAKCFRIDHIICC